MSKHLKRLAAPRSIQLHRKEHTWTTKPSPGPHALQTAVPLTLIIRDYLQLCDTYREAKTIIANGAILVDGIPQKNHKFPCGLMDVISLPKLKKDYRLLYDQKGKLALVAISAADAKWKLCRIEHKTMVKHKKIQLNFHDGNNKIVDKDDYKTGDVLKITLPDKKINDVYPFQKGTIAMITGGSHIGQLANIDDIELVSSSKPNLAKMKGDKPFFTIQEYVFPLGKTKPVITLPEVKMT